MRKKTHYDKKKRRDGIWGREKQPQYFQRNKVENPFVPVYCAVSFKLYVESENLVFSRQITYNALTLL